jgi:hypothetical protein
MKSILACLFALCMVFATVGCDGPCAVQEDCCCCENCVCPEGECNCCEDCECIEGCECNKCCKDGCELEN